MLEYFRIVFGVCVSFIILIFVVITMSGGAVKQFICKKCGKLFDRETRLKAHQKKCGQGDFICEKCDMIFNRESRLTAHRQKHNNKHECNICGHFFQKGRDLRRHKERANVLSCGEHCQRGFCSLDALQTRQRSTNHRQLVYRHPEDTVLGVSQSVS